MSLPVIVFPSIFLLSNSLTDRKSLCCYSRGAVKRPTARLRVFGFFQSCAGETFGEKALGSSGFVDLIEGLSQRVANQGLANALTSQFLIDSPWAITRALGARERPVACEDLVITYFNERSRPTALSTAAGK